MLFMSKPSQHHSARLGSVWDVIVLQIREVTSGGERPVLRSVTPHTERRGSEITLVFCGEVGLFCF